MAKLFLVTGLLAAALMVHSAFASDPELITDFNVSNATVNDFTFRGFENLAPQGKGVAVPTAAAIKALSGLGLAVVQVEYGPKSQLDPHTHPRGTELLYVLSGVLDVGFVDTANNLFETNIKAGDIFVFPKGSLHWQRNNGKGTASALAVFSVENPGRIFTTKALFTAGGKGLPDIVLSTAVGRIGSDAEIEKVKKSVAVRYNVTLPS